MRHDNPAETLSARLIPTSDSPVCLCERAPLRVQRRTLACTDARNTVMPLHAAAAAGSDDR